MTSHSTVVEKYKRLFDSLKFETGAFAKSGWDSESADMDPTLFDDVTLSTYVCRAFDLWFKVKERRLPPNSWPIVYDAFFESFWEEEMIATKDLWLT